MTAAHDVFTAAKLSPISLRNRIIKSATFEAATPNALVTESPAARGGRGRHDHSGLPAVSPGGRTEGKHISWRPEAMPGLRKLTDATHAEGAAITAQIGHAGPVANAKPNKAKAHANAARMAIDAGFDAVEIHWATTTSPAPSGPR